MYNSIYITISAASASLAAILGGLIAQKVIDINNQLAQTKDQLTKNLKEKNSISDRIAELDERIIENRIIEFIGINRWVNTMCKIQN